MIIIPEQAAKIGDTVEHEGKKYLVREHFAQGKDLKNSTYTHMMFNNRGAFGMVEA